MKKVFHGLFPLCLILLWACDTADREACVEIPDASGVSIDFSFESFADTLTSLENKDELVAFFTREPEIRDYLFRRHLYPDDSVFINDLYRRFTSPAFDTLLTETNRVFGDQSDLQAQFEQAFRNIKFHYPDFLPPKVKTVITGLDHDLHVSDSLILVSLDFFLGPGARYRPRMYDYLLRQYEPANIVPSCLLIYGISDRFNKTDLEDKTVLADMIAYGKSFYFAKHMLPCVPDSTLIWYTREEIEGSRKNQDLIWARLVQDQVLFSTSHMVRQKYLGERPKTLEVGEKCPGRIGQWIGWQIVSKFMENHPVVSLPELMQTSDAQRLFRESGYKPEKR